MPIDWKRYEVPAERHGGAPDQDAWQVLLRQQEIGQCRQSLQISMENQSQHGQRARPFIFDAVLDFSNTNRDVLLDKGYADSEREDRLTRQGLAHVHPEQRKQGQANFGGCVCSLIDAGPANSDGG